MNRRESLWTSLRNSLLQWEAAMRKATYATSVEITPVTSTGFSIIFRWRDSSVFEKKIDKTAFGVTSNYSVDAAQLQMRPCRFRKEVIADALRFKGI
jgi:hypothetical protein